MSALCYLGQVQGESSRIYGLLQDAVDRAIQHVSFAPDESYGMDQPPNGASTNFSERESFRQTERFLEVFGRGTAVG